ncbi:MAG: flagellar hook-associated protein FlgK, partial [Tumebacillaceae bacterium]
EPSDTGLSKVLNNFYNAWQALGRDPENLPARSVVKQATSDLATMMNTMDAKLAQLDSDTKQNVSSMVSQFNTITGQIVSINKQVTTLETLGDKANDLRDQRDYLVDQLSKMADINATELSDGTYQITLGGQMIVNGPTPAVQLVYDETANTTNIPVTSGQIGGTMASRTDYVSMYRSQLDSLVNGLVNGKFNATLPNDYQFDTTVTTLPYDVTLPNGTVMHKGDSIAPGFKLPAQTQITFAGINELHSFGFTMQSPTTQAGPLFVTNDGSTTFTAANLRVSKDVLDDVRNIASSDMFYIDANGKNQVKSGNGDVAFMLGGAVNATIDFKDGLPPNSAILTKGTVSDYMRAVVGQLGEQGQTADRQVQNSDALVQQVDNRRQSVSGVSIDEEMSNMIKYQQSYAAAARMINTVDTMLDTVINRMMS